MKILIVVLYKYNIVSVKNKFSDFIFIVYLFIYFIAPLTEVLKGFDDLEALCGKSAVFQCQVIFEKNKTLRFFSI